MTTRFRTPSPVAAALVLGLSLTVTGCGKYSFSALKAQKAYKEANDAYRAQDWKKAVEKYEYAIQQDPSKSEVYFYLANSYDNRYKPGRAGEPENDALIQKAVEYYKQAAEKSPEPQIKKLALQYLVSAYGQEKLNDPSQAEPIVQQMIQIEPNEPSNYFALANIYEGAGRYEDAEAAYVKARDMKPNDPVVHTTLAGFYNRQGQFDKTMEAMNKAADLEPNNPQGYHLVATYYQEKVQKDHTITPAVKKDYIARGLAADDKALSLNPNYIEAMIYKNILLREQARLETDRAKQQELMKQADELRNKAMDLQKKRAAAGTN
jgi:tetratricopeptide (TPR) repeat protein